MTIQKWIVFSNQHILFDDSPQSHCLFPIERIQHFLNEDGFVFSFQIELDVKLSCFFHQGEKQIDDESLSWYPLREGFEKLDQTMVQHVVKAYGFLQWHHQYRFCSQCGAVLILQKSNFEKYCSHCHEFFYPTLSPSVIVRIKRGNEILLARPPHFKPGIYGLIAGFVEIGETLEQAVHREVKEETNLSVCNLHYFDSQFWPFPHSFMVGFTADYLGGELIVNGEELQDARWFDRSHLPLLPNSKSIAYRLIDDFRQGANQ